MNTINKDIVATFKANGINKDAGILYLLALHYNLSADIFEDDFRVSVNKLGIANVSENSLSWTVPLFENQETHFEWVINKYIPLFTKIGKSPYTRECVSRMKEFFKNYPEYRVDDVLKAAEEYINSDPYGNKKYIQEPHYFIVKGVGVQKTSNLLNWLEKTKETVPTYTKSLNTILQ